MVTTDELRAVLERVARKEEGAGDLQLLRQALARGEITAVTGERAVAIGRDATDVVIITGDGNIVNVFEGVDAHSLREVLEVLVANSYRGDYTLLLLFPILIALLWAASNILPGLIPRELGGVNLVALSVLLAGLLAIIVILAGFLGRRERLKPTVMEAFSLLQGKRRLKPKPNVNDNMSQRATYPYQLPITPDQSQTAVVGEGTYGGAIGGALAGLLDGLSFHLLGLSSYFASGSTWEGIALPSIFIYSCVAGMGLGFATQLGILIVHQLWRSSLSEVVGSTLGGAGIGIGIGALGGWIFGSWPSPFVNISVFQGSLALGAMCIAVAIRWHIYRLAWVKAGVIFVVAFFITGVLFLVASRVLSEPIASIRDNLFFSESALLHTEGGMILGAVFGAAIGFIVGLTAAVYDWWQRPKLLSAVH
jgi:hypothetical protein